MAEIPGAAMAEIPGAAMAADNDAGNPDTAGPSPVAAPAALFRVVPAALSLGCPEYARWKDAKLQMAVAMRDVDAAKQSHSVVEMAASAARGISASKRWGESGADIARMTARAAEDLLIASWAAVYEVAREKATVIRGVFYEALSPRKQALLRDLVRRELRDYIANPFPVESTADCIYRCLISLAEKPQIKTCVSLIGPLCKAMDWTEPQPGCNIYKVRCLPGNQHDKPYMEAHRSQLAELAESFSETIVGLDLSVLDIFVRDEFHHAAIYKEWIGAIKGCARQFCDNPGDPLIREMGLLGVAVSED